MDTPGVEVEDEVPLGWLLAQSTLKLRPIHLAEDTGTVSWVHAIELDDPSPWLRPGGLVLTTGLRLPRGKGPQAQYVESLVRAGAVGLGFGTGLRFDAVPGGVVDACRHQGLSLVEVPLRTPFLAVTQAVSDRISQQRRWRVQEVLDAQRALTRSALKGGPPAVVRTLSRLLRAVVDLADADLVELASAGSTGPGTHAGAVRETQLLGAQRLPIGRLELARATALSPSERLVLNHAVSLLSLDLAQLHRPAEEDRASLLGSLLGPAGFDPAAVLAPAGFDLDRPVVLMGVLAAESLTTGAVAGQLRRNLPQPHLYGSAPTGRGPERFFLVPEESAGRFENALVEAANRRANRLTLVVGAPAPLQRIGITLPGVLRLLSSAPPAPDRVHVARVMDAEHRELLPTATWSDIATATMPWTDLLAANDRTHGTALLQTLAVFLDHHGRPDPAARALGIHRHTLRHRLTRAQTVGGFDLDDPTHRALLVLALQGRELTPTLSP